MGRNQTIAQDTAVDTDDRKEREKGIQSSESSPPSGK